MTAPAPLHGGFAEPEMYDILDQACSAMGLDSTIAEVLRGHTNAVVLLKHAPVVAKIARRGTDTEASVRTAEFVRWLMARGFPTVPLHPQPERQPVVANGHAVTFWTYLPQPDHPVTSAQIAGLLAELHSLPTPPAPLPPLANLAAIRSSLSSITTLPDSVLQALTERTDRLERELSTVRYALQETVVQGDPQHRNALHDGTAAVLCDWDTVAYGQPEWDLVTIEIHCRRFGYGRLHYQQFAEAYRFDVTAWPGYPVLRDIRELRMVTTNARKSAVAPGTLHEVERRIAGLRMEDPTLRWNIL